MYCGGFVSCWITPEPGGAGGSDGGTITSCGTITGLLGGVSGKYCGLCDMAPEPGGAGGYEGGGIGNSNDGGSDAAMVSSGNDGIAKGL